MCLASFIEISCELGQNWALVNYDKKKKKKKKKNNSVDETREQQDPIPSFQRGWDNNNSVHETREEQDPIPFWGMG